MSLWSGSPSKTRVRQVPQIPCSQDVGIFIAASASSSTTVLSGAIGIVFPDLASRTENVSSVSSCRTSPLKNS